MRRPLAISLLTAIILTLTSQPVRGQIITTSTETKINADSVREAFDKALYFGLYKDNYFIFGIPVGSECPSKYNSNVKFQISISQRLTKSVLPWHTYLYLFYTQKCFWNILENSLPMTDLNFNPGIGLAKPLFIKDRFIGKLMMVLEHESNGRDGDDSRSWNRVTFGANIIVDPTLMVHGKVWIPIIDGQNNKDILDYYGIYQMGVTFTSPNKRFGASIVLMKRRGWNFNYNTIVELNYRIFKRDNQFIFLQYYNGYGEGLLEYNRFHSMLRAGIVIKPQLFSDY
ncbi:MAG: phospholipase A [Pseudoflavonifractor sp.]|nr:phospholipase A [Pseudoflavonifractor sp.]